MSWVRTSIPFAETQNTIKTKGENPNKLLSCRYQILPRLQIFSQTKKEIYHGN